MVISTDCIGTCSCKSYYHTITTAAAPNLICVIYIKYNFHLGLGEECSDNEGGCSWEEVIEVHNDEEGVSTMNTQLLLKKSPNKHMRLNINYEKER